MNKKRSIRSSRTGWGVVKVLCSIGYVKRNLCREKAIKRIKESGYKMANFIASGANCWPGSIEEDAGVLVFDNAFVGVGCHLKEGVIISEGSVLSHNVTVEPYCFFSDGVVVVGHANIGRNSFVGLNSTIKSNCRIGNYNIIGSGANVIHDTEDYCVARGNPAIVQI